MHKHQGWPQAWDYCQAKPIQTLGRASQGMDWSWSQCIKTGEAQNLSCLESSVKFLKSVMIWGAVTSAGVALLCFIKSKVNAAVYQEILEHFMLPSADKLYGDADFLFQQDFSTYPQCQNHFQVVCWPWYYCAWLASQHAWPEPIWNLWDIF